MYEILLKSHSGLRYVVFLLIVLAILSAFIGWFGNKPFTGLHKKLNLFTLISAHLQATLGLVLYFVSPWVQLGNMGAAMKDAGLRYWSVEHIAMMLIAVVLITIGYSKSKKQPLNTGKHGTIAIFYSLAVIIIVAAILQSGRGLFGMTH